MPQILICTLLMLAWNGTLCAKVLDIRELNTEQIDQLDRTRTAVLLTAGILEEHGPFLPSYTDGYQSDFIATRVANTVAARSGWTVLRFPEIPLGAFPASYVGGKYAFPGSYPVRMDDAASGIHGSRDRPRRGGVQVGVRCGHAWRTDAQPGA